MSISVDVTGLDELARIKRHIESLNGVHHQARLLNLIGAEVETQTRRRISEEKTAPDGSPWQAWSDAYAKSRTGGHSLLDSSGRLLDSISYQIQGNNVHVGSNALYAAMHQDGFDESVNIAAHTRLITQAFGRALKHPVYQTVKAHTRNMFMPLREFLGLSSDNEHDLLALIVKHHKKVLQ